MGQKLLFLTRFLTLFLAVGLLLTPLAGAQGKSPPSRGGAYNFTKKATSKEGVRWTLQDWLAQKDRNHLMDLWLGMYAPSPYEFYIAGQMQSYDRTTSTLNSSTADAKASYRSSAGSVAAYATVVGLMGEYENNTEEGYNESSGSLNLRVLGNAVQGTHMIANYGQRTRNTAVAGGGVSTLKNQFAGAELDVYVFKYFGLHSSYRNFIAASDASLGDVSGAKTEAGAFIDFGPMRVFGNWYQDRQDSVLSGVTTRILRNGVQSGLKIFF